MLLPVRIVGALYAAGDPHGFGELASAGIGLPLPQPLAEAVSGRDVILNHGKLDSPANQQRDVEPGLRGGLDLLTGGWLRAGTSGSRPLSYWAVSASLRLEDVSSSRDKSSDHRNRRNYDCCHGSPIH